MSVVCITKIIHTKCHYGYIICVIQQCLSLVQYTEQLNVAYRLSGLMEKINTILRLLVQSRLFCHEKGCVSVMERKNFREKWKEFLIICVSRCMAKDTAQVIRPVPEISIKLDRTEQIRGGTWTQYFQASKHCTSN
jgi:hypothetical protein